MYYAKMISETSIEMMSEQEMISAKERIAKMKKGNEKDYLNDYIKSFKELVQESFERNETDCVSYSYKLKGNKIYQIASIQMNAPHMVNQKINSLKVELSLSDYKIIKCMEAQLVGEELPYDIKEVHGMRTKIRTSINELKTLLP